MHVDASWAALLAAAVTIAALLTARSINPIARWLLMLGGGCIALALGNVSLNGSRPARAIVMIDESASTRTANYHDADWLRRRLHVLLPNQSAVWQTFSEASAPRTEWNPASADAIVLFGDGQFDLPASMPPTWVVGDAALDAPHDAAIDDIRRDGDDATLIVRNGGTPRTLQVGGELRTIEAGGMNLVLPLNGATTARLAGGDAWPENDSLPIPPPLQSNGSRWWVGDAPPAGWTAIDLPGDLPAYGDAGVIALHGATRLSTVQSADLQRYVTELGGGLLLIRSRASDDLSPISMDAPTPQHRWLVLIDRSGSMATPLGASTRFAAAVAAARQLLSALPVNDRVAIGSFARDLKWWIDDRVIDARRVTWPPPDASPSGPTNLETILPKLLLEGGGGLSTDIIVLTDSDAPIADAAGMTRRLNERRARLNVLSIDADNPTLASIAAATGGETFAAASAIDLEHHAETVASHVVPAPSSADLNFAPSMNLSPRQVVSWQPAWLRDGAIGLAATTSGQISAAEGSRGVGKVIACSFEPSAAELSTFAKRVEAPPLDPRFQITLDDGRVLRIVASESNRHLNDLPLSVSLDRQPGVAMEQVAPGTYSSTFDAAAQARIATITLDGVPIRRQIIPARYPREFDAIGNNMEKISEIARRSGGGVVSPDQQTPIKLPMIRWRFSLTSPLLAAGAASCLAALWRRKL